jgi:integrase
MTTPAPHNDELSRLVADAWKGVSDRSVAADKEAIPPLRDWLAGQANRHAALLTGKRPTGTADDQSARHLEALLLGRVASKELTITTAAQQLNLLHRVGKRLRNQQVAVAPTWISSILRPPPSPFPSETALSIAKVEAWRTALNSLLSAPIADDSPALWALTVLSAICHGALVDRAKIVQLRLMLARSRLSLKGTDGQEHCFIEFMMAFEGLGHHHLQRWWVDPASEILLSRFPAAGDLPAIKDTIKVVAGLLAKAGVERSLLPAKLSDLLQSATIWWAARCAPVDLHAMRRTFATHQLTARCWKRLKGWPAEREPGAMANTGRGVAIEERRTADTEAELMGAATAEHEWLSEVCEALSSCNLDTARAWVDTYLSGVAPDDYRHIYVGWLASALAVPPRNADIPVGLAAFMAPFMLAASRLLSYFGTTDPRTLPVGELDETYRTILDACEHHEPVEGIARGLRLFHEHLVRAHKAQHLPNPRATFGEGGALMPVDATVISVDEYFAAIEWLDKQLELGADPTETAICRIVLLLTFRCGLRRGEVFGLRLCDVHDRAGIYLHVRRYPSHRLKTPNSTRTLRIDPLLTVRERARLRHWCADRSAMRSTGPQQASQQRRLLARQGPEGDVISIDGTVRRVMQAVHAVTEEPRLVLHHLRHSCASWLWLKLRAPDYPQIEALLTSMPRLLEEVRRAKRLRVQLCGTAAGPSRSYTHVIARVLGHSTPGTSLEHYIHIGDLFLAAATSRTSESFPVSVWQGLTGASRATVYQWLACGGTHGVVEGYRAQRAPPTAASAPTLNPWRKKIAAPSIRFGGEGSLAKVSRVLQAFNRLDITMPHGKRVEAAAERCGATNSQVESWLASARSLAHTFNMQAPTAAGRDLRFKPVPAPEMQLQQSSVMALDDLTKRLAAVAEHSPALVSAAFALVPSRFNRRRLDVVFRGPKDEVAARTFIKLLDLAGLMPDRLRLTVRRLQAEDTELPSWFRVPRAKGLTVKRIPPPGTEANQARAYRKWVGLQLCSSGGEPDGHAWRIGLFLACIAHTDLPANP